MFKFEHTCISLHMDLHCLHEHISLHTSVHCTCISTFHVSCHFCVVFPLYLQNLWIKEKIKTAYIYTCLVCFLWYQYYVVFIPFSGVRSKLKGGRARLIKILTSQKKEGLLVNRPPLPVSTPMPLNLRLSQLMYPHSYDE